MPADTTSNPSTDRPGGDPESPNSDVIDVFFTALAEQHPDQADLSARLRRRHRVRLR